MGDILQKNKGIRMSKLGNQKACALIQLKHKGSPSMEVKKHSIARAEQEV